MSSATTRAASASTWEQLCAGCRRAGDGSEDLVCNGLSSLIDTGNLTHSTGTRPRAPECRLEPGDIVALGVGPDVACGSGGSPVVPGLHLGGSVRVVRYHFRVQEVVAKVGYCKNNRNSYFNIVMQYEVSSFLIIGSRRTGGYPSLAGKGVLGVSLCAWTAQLFCQLSPVVVMTASHGPSSSSMAFYYCFMRGLCHCERLFTQKARKGGKGRRWPPSGVPD